MIVFGDERPAPPLLAESAEARRSFERYLGEALGISVTAQLGDALVQEVASEPPRLLECDGGACARGRR